MSSSCKLGWGKQTHKKENFCGIGVNDQNYGGRN